MGKKELKLDKHQSERIVNSIQDQFDGDVSVSVYVKKKAPKQSNYVMFYQAVNLELVKVLKPNACKVLLYLMSKTGYDNYVGVNQETIQEELDYSSKTSVVNAINELKAYNIIKSMPDIIDKRRNVYYINPYQSWKGKVAKRIEVVKKANSLEFTQLSLPFTDKTDLL
jgi:DNA-binding MarR family transcriptional regulator